MKIKSIYLVFLSLVVFLNSGCERSSVQTRLTEYYMPDSGENLISNGSFENDGIPATEGWQFGNPQLAELIEDAPEDGGSWSLQLTSDWAPTSGYAYMRIPKVESGDIVKLSAYVRATGPNGSRGIIYLKYGNHIKSASSNDTVWTKVSVTDTLNLAENDTLKVYLSAPVTEVVPFTQLFDLIRLEKISK